MQTWRSLPGPPGFCKSMTHRLLIVLSRVALVFLSFLSKSRRVVWTRCFHALAALKGQESLKRIFTLFVLAAIVSLVALFTPSSIYAQSARSYFHHVCSAVSAGSASCGAIQLDSQSGAVTPLASSP